MGRHFDAVYLRQSKQVGDRKMSEKSNELRNTCYITENELLSHFIYMYFLNCRPSDNTRKLIRSIQTVGSQEIRAIYIVDTYIVR